MKIKKVSKEECEEALEDLITKQKRFIKTYLIELVDCMFLRDEEQILRLSKERFENKLTNLMNISTNIQAYTNNLNMKKLLETVETDYYLNEKGIPIMGKDIEQRERRYYS